MKNLTAMKSRLTLAALFVPLLLLVTPALTAAPPAEDHAAALRRQMQEFERVVTITLRQMFEDRPFAILEQPKSVYLEGFGVVVHAEVNLFSTSPLLGFASEQYRQSELQAEREQKVLRLRQLQVRLREMVLEQNAGLTALGKDESVALVIHLFNVRPYPEIPNQVVAQARRQALLELAGNGRKPDAAELARAISVREF